MRFGVLCFAFFLSLVSIPTAAEARLRYTAVCSTFEDAKLITDHYTESVDIDDSGFPAVIAAKVEQGACAFGGMEFSCGYDPRTDADAVYVREDEDGSYYVLKREQDKDGEKVVRFVTYWDWYPEPRFESVAMCLKLEDAKLVVDTYADFGMDAGKAFIIEMKSELWCWSGALAYSCQYDPRVDAIHTRETPLDTFIVTKFERDEYGPMGDLYILHLRPTELPLD